MNIKDTIYGIVIGVISSLIASGIVYAATEILLWNVRVPLWIWLLGSVIVLCVVQIVICLKQYFHIKNVIAEYTEGYFGDSFKYVWDYKKSKDERYSIYGYEPTRIRTDKPLHEMNNGKVFTCGHEVSEDTIKLMIKLTLICKVNKRMGKKLQPILEYMHWLENSQYHQL